MKKTLNIFLLVGILCLTIPVSSQAGNPVDPDPSKNDSGLVNTSTSSITQLNLGITSPVKAALNMMNLALSLLGGLCLVLLIYAGFLWVWARGEEEKITQAKDIIKGTVIGLLIVLASLGITQYVFVQVANITGAEVQKTSSEEDPD
ncbi:MAG: hypothetical protein WCW27_00115 [Patescibacteria group bacterium]|jgi:hypothetical protein